MSNKDKLIVTIVILLVAATGGALYFYFKKKEEEEKNAKLQQDNLRLVLESIKQNKSLSDEIKRQLTNLIAQYQNIDIKVANEISHAINLMELGETEAAIQNMVKVIEHLLSFHYQDHVGFKAWLKKEKKKLDLHGLLTFCKVEQKISEVEYQFFLAIKKIRDKEVHTLDLKIDEYLNASGLITAVGGVMKLSTVVYPAKVLN
jgi:ribonuclease HII